MYFNKSLCKFHFYYAGLLFKTSDDNIHITCHHKLFKFPVYEMSFVVEEGNEKKKTLAKWCLLHQKGFPRSFEFRYRLLVWAPRLSIQSLGEKPLNETVGEEFFGTSDGFARDTLFYGWSSKMSFLVLGLIFRAFHKTALLRSSALAREFGTFIFFYRRLGEDTKWRDHLALREFGWWEMSQLAFRLFVRQLGPCDVRWEVHDTRYVWSVKGGMDV